MTSPRQRAWASRLGRGFVALTIAALLPIAGASIAHAAEDDPDAGATTGGAMVITVDVPEHTGAAYPSPTSTTPPAPAGALPATGDDVQGLLPWLLGAGAVTTVGMALAARRRRA